MQKSDKLSFGVLTASGDILATLEYPRETRLWAIIDLIKKKINKSSCVPEQELILRSSQGIVLYPHMQLGKSLHGTNGAHLVAEFEPLNSENHVKKSAKKMKQGRTGLNSQEEDVVVRERTVPDRGRPAWGKYRIPLRKSGSPTQSQDHLKRNSQNSGSSEGPSQVIEINDSDRTKRTENVDLTDGSSDHDKRRRSGTLSSNVESSQRVIEINDFDRSKRREHVDLTDGSNSYDKRRRSCPSASSNMGSSQHVIEINHSDRRKKTENIDLTDNGSNTAISNDKRRKSGSKIENNDLTDNGSNAAISNDKRRKSGSSIMKSQSVKEINDSSERKRMDQNVSKHVDTRRRSGRSLSVGTTPDSEKVANSALGSLMQNYSNDDDEDEDEDNEAEDVRGSILKKPTPLDAGRNGDNDEEDKEVDFPKLAKKSQEVTASLSSKKSSKGTKKKCEQESSEKSGGEFSQGIGKSQEITVASSSKKQSKDTNKNKEQESSEKSGGAFSQGIGKSQEVTVASSSKKQRKDTNKNKEQESSEKSGGAFSQGIGNFLNALRSESQKPQPPLVTISAMQTKGNKRSMSSTDSHTWPKSSLRTYSKRKNTSGSQAMSGVDVKKVKKDNQNSSFEQPRSSQNSSSEPPSSSSQTSLFEVPSWSEPASSSKPPCNDVANDIASSFLSSFDDDLENHQLTIETTTKRTYPSKSPVALRTRSGKSSSEGIDEKDVPDKDVDDNADGNKDAKEDADAEEDVWEMDVVLLSIQCKGPITNRQLASCINGIMLDLQEESKAKLEALTVDELQKKLEEIFQQDLSLRKKCIDYVFQKLKRDGPKKKVSSAIVVTVGRINVTKTDLYTLADSNWLNDNIINAYFHLLPQASKKKVFAQSTFFYSKLTRKGYDSVKRWTDQVDLFAHDLVLVPVHLRNHWTLAAIHVQQHRIEYYNSLGSNNARCLGVLIDYLRKEATIRERHLFTALKWSTGFMKGLPQQKNGSDCGVYVCQYAKRLCLGKPVKFTTMESIGFRKDMVKELVANGIQSS